MDLQNFNTDKTSTPKLAQSQATQLKAENVCYVETPIPQSPDQIDSQTQNKRNAKAKAKQMTPVNKPIIRRGRPAKTIKEVKVTDDAPLTQAVQGMAKGNDNMEKMKIDSIRTQLSRKVKAHQDGELGSRNLQKRTIGGIQTSKRSKDAIHQDKPLTKEQTLVASFNPADPYSLIRIEKNQQNENIQCDVCLDFEDGEGDEIVICELCLGATHQSCYGSEIKDQLPANDEPWYCCRCQILLQDQSQKCIDIRCVLCPQIEGIMKPMGPNSSEWAHVVCVNKTPGIWWADDSITVISGKTPSQLDQVKCRTCKLTRGSTIPCEYKSCPRSYHVRCAIKKGIIGVADKMNQDFDTSETEEKPNFCLEHNEIGKKAYKEKGISALIGSKVEKKKPVQTNQLKKKEAGRPKIGCQKAGKQVPAKQRLRKVHERRAARKMKVEVDDKRVPVTKPEKILQKEISKTRTRVKVSEKKIAPKSGVHQKHQNLKKAGKTTVQLATNEIVKKIIDEPSMMAQLMQQVENTYQTPLPPQTQVASAHVPQKSKAARGRPKSAAKKVPARKKVSPKCKTPKERAALLNSPI